MEGTVEMFSKLSALKSHKLLGKSAMMYRDRLSIVRGNVKFAWRTKTSSLENFKNGMVKPPSKKGNKVKDIWAFLDEHTAGEVKVAGVSFTFVANNVVIFLAIFIESRRESVDESKEWDNEE
ncbi:hypothetical protein HAX54_003403 [Datura stramonium]|uniref:Uncharacterized protein n=1 Tax=Datura stramonium TaxID=4076 RepID=A0ABS8WVX8_DATST|nr:hypothetical protein [Datura stramonium]